MLIAPSGCRAFPRGTSTAAQLSFVFDHLVLDESLFEAILVATSSRCLLIFRFEFEAVLFAFW